MARRRFLRGIAIVRPAQGVEQLLCTGQAPRFGGKALTEAHHVAGDEAMPGIFVEVFH
jgi:hypothetical protein